MPAPGNVLSPRYARGMPRTHPARPGPLPVAKHARTHTPMCAHDVHHACTPAVTVAHLNAAAVSNTAIAPSSSLLPPLSSRRSAGARRVATAARAAAAVALSPTQCHFCRRGSAALPPGIRTRVRSENCLCVLRAHSSLAQAKFSFPVADCQSRAFGSF